MNPMAKFEYKFPVSDPFIARDVTAPDFDITETEKWEQTLMVELNDFRTPEKGPFLEFLSFQLNIAEEHLTSLNQHHQKIIFSGHRGSGKTLELNLASEYLHHRDRYFTVFIELEKVLPVSEFEPEDFFVLLITKLAEQAAKSGLTFNTEAFDDLATEWLSDVEIKTEHSTKKGQETSGGAGVKFGIASFLELGANFKAIFSSHSLNSKTIRENVRNNPVQLIAKLNTLFQAMRESLEYHQRLGLGKDLLFVLDGSEKANNEVYKKLFIEDQYLISKLQVNLIASVPIQSFYDIQYSAQQSEYTDYLMPMVDLSIEGAPAKLAEVVTRRVDADTFFGDNTLPELSALSGGSPRELLKIVNSCFQQSRGKRITPAILERVKNLLGRKMLDRMTSEHKQALRAYKMKEMTLADPPFRDMLTQLFVIKSNGSLHVHPLLGPLLSDEEIF